MDEYVQPFWGATIIGEDELEPEEINWDAYVKETPSGLRVIDEEDLPPETRAQLPWNIGMDEEEPDINLIYGYYEESEFY